MKQKYLNNQKGVATLIALIMIGMLTMLGLAAIITSQDEVTIAGNELQEMRAFYAAESGLEVAGAALQNEYDSTGVPPLVMPSGNQTLNQCQVAYSVVDDGPATQRILIVGSLAGLHALVKTFSIASTATSSADGSRVVMSEAFETALVPIFQFAVFYGNDLEIAPGPAMTLAGRVHTNGSLYLQSNNSLNIDSYVTTASDILHGRKGGGSVSNGDVRVKDMDGNYVSMKMGGGWLDATDGVWYDSSAARWGGRVQDRSHGQPELQLPLAGGNDPHKIIERGAGNPDSYENLATLTIIDGVAMRYMEDGNWQNVTAAMAADGVLSYSPDKFEDQRESVMVDVTELDINKMYLNGYYPLNGVVYFADDASGGDWPALRLNNADELDAGLTLVSENPLYTVGDFNSVNKQPAALMADAITFLSDAWDDAKSSLSKNTRIAQTTTVNVAYLTGNVETTPADYNGGFENLPRFLEKWSGTPFNWSGSAVCLWNSVQANSDWNGTYYSPPVRNWVYDMDLDDPNKLPPETPSVRVFQRTGWVQHDIGYNYSGPN